MRKLMDNNLIEVHELKMHFPVVRGLLRHKVADIKAVDGVSFHVNRGETFGLVGESGCGKTTLGRCILRLYEPTSGRIIFNDVDITNLRERKLRPLRKAMGAIFQDPYNSLDPRQNAGDIVGEPLKIHHMFDNRKSYTARVQELFNLVELDPKMADRVPHEFSGGQRQRLGIASAIACNPSIIICDEPISALDVSIQVDIINLLKHLQEEMGLTYLFIAHDLSVVRYISDRIAVMYLGHIVEISESWNLYKNPLHPYTKALLSAVPIPDPYIEENRKRIILKGQIPSPINPPLGCPFHPRCSQAISDCTQTIPNLQDIGDGHQVACFRV